MKCLWICLCFSTLNIAVGYYSSVILFSMLFVPFRSGRIMYAYIIRRRIFYANFFPESLFLSHKASFHHEKLAEWPKSYTYWRFPNSIRTKHATSYLHYAHILDLLKTWNHRLPALLLRKEVIVVLGAGWHNLLDVWDVPQLFCW